VSVQAGGVGLRHYNLSISTSDQMIAHKFRGKLDRAAILDEMTAAVAVARAAVRRAGGAQEAGSIGVNAEDASRTDDGYLLEFALAARDAGASRVRYCDTIGGDSPGRNAFAHESGIHADGALKDRGNYELYDDAVLGPFPSDWYAREGRVVLTGEYGGKAGFRHVLDGLGIPVAEGEEDLVFSLVQLCASATGKPLTDDELRLIAGYPQQLALLFPGQLLTQP
jgi:homocitrate synthase NifV